MIPFAAQPTPQQPVGITSAVDARQTSDGVLQMLCFRSDGSSGWVNANNIPHQVTGAYWASQFKIVNPVIPGTTLVAETSSDAAHTGGPTKARDITGVAVADSEESQGS